MPDESCYRVNAPQVISEIIDGEAIILNFETGNYYSLNESGMAIWQVLQLGWPESAILADLQRRFSDAGDSVASDLSCLVERLVAEQLILPAGVATDCDGSPYQGPVVTYVKPVLEKFSDLQELLLLDPIHDVDESGWPHHTP